MYVTAIVLAAGRGLRFSRPTNFTVKGGTKPLIEINSKPLIIYCLNILSNHPYIRDIIVVVNLENSRSIISKIKQYRIKKITDVVLGGRLRQNSVINGLKAMDARTDWVLIHDGVRPFIDKDTVSSVIKVAKECGAAIVGVPVKATIKKVIPRSGQARSSLARDKQGHPSTALGTSKVTSEFIVEKTLNRDNLWEIQTPQVFKKELILKAYEEFGDMDVTDDASLIERLGAKVKIVKGSYTNIKITTPEDLILAEAIAKDLKG